MLICLIPPHVREHERNIIWSTLEAHALDPQPLKECAKKRLSYEQVTALCAVLEFAPIPRYDDERTERPYLLIELRSPNPAAKRFLKDALEQRIEGTARIPLWEGGQKRHRSIRSHGHPQAYLREILIVPNDDAQGMILRFFHNNEDDQEAA